MTDAPHVAAGPTPTNPITPAAPTTTATTATGPGSAEVDLAALAARAGFGHLAVVVAKTPLSLSHDPALTGSPTGWRLPVREVRLAAGAGYVYAICGSVSTMPGLPSRPAAERIDVDPTTGEITGLR
ncbi:MAG: formate--tetrahydrofolate ligase [Actinomyces sp.]|uniref:formate--tetrahydrofolate ligase n=1 Tax=Actinomyces sp. TaxID=29317 RepID=UPI0026DC721E|nr:formate--tetrahydrofolate ligase [Actinomyces sp.]MDO4243346.1 formate--tetrahydrofolate ligase [Actinomyces sp.]